MRFEFDLSGAGSEKGAILNIYRVGYGKDDSAEKPYITVSAEKNPDTNINEIFTAENKYQVHNVDIYVETSSIKITIDGKGLISDKPAQRGGGPGFSGGGGNFGPQGSGGSSFSISNYGSGNNYNPFPNLNSIGFATEPGDEVVYTNYMIKNGGSKF